MKSNRDPVDLQKVDWTERLSRMLIDLDKLACPLSSVIKTTLLPLRGEETDIGVPPPGVNVLCGEEPDTVKQPQTGARVPPPGRNNLGKT